jgi:hypothetical protein
MRKGNGNGNGSTPAAATAAQVQAGSGNVLRAKASSGMPGQAVMLACVQPVLQVLQAATAAGLPGYGGTPTPVQVQGAIAVLQGTATCGHVTGPRGSGTTLPVPAAPGYGRGKGKLPGKVPALPGNVQQGLQALQVLYYGNAAAGLPGNPQQAQRYYTFAVKHVQAAHAAAVQAQLAAAAARPARKAPAGKGKLPARSTRKGTGKGTGKAPAAAAPVQAPAAPAAPAQGTGTPGTGAAA